MIAAGDDRQHGGNDGYDDHLESYYSWNESVPNARNVRVGDQLVVWDKERLLGAATVEDIVETAADPSANMPVPTAAADRRRERPGRLFGSARSATAARRFQNVKHGPRISGASKRCTRTRG